MDPFEHDFPQIDLHFTILLPTQDVANMLAHWYVLIQIWAHMRHCCHG